MPDPKHPRKSVVCGRCDVAMQFMGTKKFHEGPRAGIWGEIGELFVNREAFDVYACPHCGVVEMFIDGWGEDLRSERFPPVAAPRQR